MTFSRRLTTILCLSLIATSVLAQTAQTTPPSRTTEPVTAETDRDANNPQALRLSLSEALGTAMRNNLGVELQTYDYRMASEALQSQYGLFDWFGTGRLSHNNTRGATISELEATESSLTTLDVGVTQNLPA